MSDRTTIVIGHKNPDTDSICSAVGYAELKTALGEKGVIAGRAGNINPQTGFALNYFKKEQPVFFPDVYPKVRDVMTRDIAAVHYSAPLCSVIKLMGSKNVRFMPVTRDDRPVGVLSMSTLAEQIIVRTPTTTSEVYTSISNISEALRAKILHAVSPGEEFTAPVFVGAMDESSFRDVIRRNRPKDSVVIVGDRTGIQEAAIDMGVRLLIITGGLDVKQEILESAANIGVSILVSPFDSATTAWLTLLSSPVGHYSSEEFINIHESITVREFKARVREGMAVVTDAGGKLTGVITPADIIRPSNIKLILVDHNELSQAVDGADEVEIEEVIDHHRLGNFHTTVPIRFINDLVGSTSTIIAERFFLKGIMPKRGTAGILLSGIISDTLMLKSPTATERDRAMIERLAPIAVVDPEAYSRELFKAGSGFLGRKPSEVVGSDFKSYEAKGRRFGVAQIEVVGFEEFYKVRDIMEEELEKIRDADRLSLAGLMVTDISYGNSVLLAVADREISASLGYPSAGKNLYELKGVLSRKKQVVPHLLNLFSKLYDR